MRLDMEDLTIWPLSCSCWLWISESGISKPKLCRFESHWIIIENVPIDQKPHFRQFEIYNLLALLLVTSDKEWPKISFHYECKSLWMRSSERAGFSFFWPAAAHFAHYIFGLCICFWFVIKLNGWWSMFTLP